MSSLNYIDDCLRRRVIFFTGKGGVGKSTVAWATALACRSRGARVTVASWSPFDEQTSPTILKLKGVGWQELETISAFKEYALRLLKFEGVYSAVFENHVLRTFLTAAPGLSDSVTSGKIWDMYDRRQQDLLLVDLPSSGHALSFFSSPMGIERVFNMGFVKKEAQKILGMFCAPDVRLDLVALPEELPLVEGNELKKKLEKLTAFHFGFLHVNQCTPKFPLPDASVFQALGPELVLARERYLARVQQEEAAMTLAPALGMPVLQIPRLPADSMNEVLEKFARHLETA